MTTQKEIRAAFWQGFPRVKRRPQNELPADIRAEFVEFVSSWPMRGSYLSDCQYHVEATIADRRYTGRTLGAGMLWRGKAKKES